MNPSLIALIVRDLSTLNVRIDCPKLLLLKYTFRAWGGDLLYVYREKDVSRAGYKAHVM